MSAKAYPLYSVVNAGYDYWIEDSAGNTVIHTVGMTCHYEDVFEQGQIMQILCDALNGMKTGKEEVQ